MSRPFIRGQVAIDSMRDNGFLSAAHALAELIDNSIQAGADRVELITFENRSERNGGARSTKRIEKIGVFDNGKGMDSETLHLALEFGASLNRDNPVGIGKFGMGLPNSSISQCKHVDVWSWTNPGKYMYTYLDIDEIKDGVLETIPEPVYRDIPEEILSAIDKPMPESGTFVLWSKIDRCQWKTGKSIFKHTQDVVGRMYRYFLEDEKVTIRFKSTELLDNLFIVDSEHRFLPNDPMYLMRDTSLPALPDEFEGEAMFEYVEGCCYSFPVSDENGNSHQVEIKGSVLKRSVLDKIRSTTNGQIGSTDWGKHAAKNYGLSIVRSRRELSLAPEFINPPGAKERGRWYGIELSFTPALDNIFGVTNNKQHVVNLKMMKASEDFEREGFDSEHEYRSDLLANNDPKLRIYEVVQHIKEVEKKLINRIETYNFKGNKGDVDEDGAGYSGVINSVTSIIKEKDEDRDYVNPTEELSFTREELEDHLREKGISKPEELAATVLKYKLKVLIEFLPMATSAFFDVSTKKGLTLLQININHAFFKRVIDKIPESEREALVVSLAGWARMERETSSDKRRLQLEMARKDWGQLLEDYLDDD
ncbi:ATP-binding protein [Parahaliea sp. F7430]|uniref:ATP-binding protein n=1 Tax=Sediminihaliea albiluteola TaxID=2758564 RepID=A0A7W2YKX5_9GAMM|nr:ATP-binding protein [Sediminihaliea albiluteola]MBA6414184.1 ATP-binding protein [Sediminihaliea albiluteola]